MLRLNCKSPNRLHQLDLLAGLEQRWGDDPLHR